MLVEWVWTYENDRMFASRFVDSSSSSIFCVCITLIIILRCSVHMHFIRFYWKWFLLCVRAVWAQNRYEIKWNTFCADRSVFIFALMCVIRFVQYTAVPFGSVQFQSVFIELLLPWHCVPVPVPLCFDASFILLLMFAFNKILNQSYCFRSLSRWFDW